MGDRGKFDNINVALQGYWLDQFDWLIVTDDDVRLPPNYTPLRSEPENPWVR